MRYMVFVLLMSLVSMQSSGGSYRIYAKSDKTRGRCGEVFTLNFTVIAAKGDQVIWTRVEKLFSKNMLLKAASFQARSGDSILHTRKIYFTSADTGKATLGPFPVLIRSAATTQTVFFDPISYTFTEVDEHGELSLKSSHPNLFLRLFRSLINWQTIGLLCVLAIALTILFLRKRAKIAAVDLEFQHLEKLEFALKRSEVSVEDLDLIYKILIGLKNQSETEVASLLKEVTEHKYSKHKGTSSSLLEVCRSVKLLLQNSKQA